MTRILPILEYPEDFRGLAVQLILIKTSRVAVPKNKNCVSGYRYMSDTKPVTKWLREYGVRKSHWKNVFNVGDYCLLGFDSQVEQVPFAIMWNELLVNVPDPVWTYFERICNCDDLYDFRKEKPKDWLVTKDRDEEYAAARQKEIAQIAERLRREWEVEEPINYLGPGAWEYLDIV